MGLLPSALVQSLTLGGQDPLCGLLVILLSGDGAMRFLPLSGAVMSGTDLGSCCPRGNGAAPPLALQRNIPGVTDHGRSCDTQTIHSRGRTTPGACPRRRSHLGQRHPPGEAFKGLNEGPQLLGLGGRGRKEGALAGWQPLLRARNLPAPQPHTLQGPSRCQEDDVTRSRRGLRTPRVRRGGRSL